MRLRTAAVDLTDDQGRRIAGPYFLPLDAEAKIEINQLARQHGPLDLKPKEPHETDR